MQSSSHCKADFVPFWGAKHGSAERRPTENCLDCEVVGRDSVEPWANNSARQAARCYRQPNWISGFEASRIKSPRLPAQRTAIPPTAKLEIPELRLIV